MIRSYKYRLCPSKAQQSQLAEMMADLCALYNAALQQRIEAYRRQGITLKSQSQWHEVHEMRHSKDHPEMSRWAASAESQVLRRLDKAFAAFFRRLKTKSKSGFPRYRARDRFHAADFQSGASLRKDGRLHVVGIDLGIKVRLHRPLPAKPNWTIVTRQAGKWYVIFQIELPDDDSQEREYSPVGIDVGLSSLIATSGGDTIATPQWTKTAAKGLRRRNRALSRCKLRSKRWRKQRARISTYHARIAAKRRDFIHKLSKELVTKHSHIALEDLDVTSLARSMFSKAISNAAWGQLRQAITYKAESAGTVVALVDPRGTSQVCAECGASGPVPKTLAVRWHDCPECGYSADRDVNSARNILRIADFSGLDRAVGRQACGVPRSLPENAKPARQSKRSQNAA